LEVVQEIDRLHPASLETVATEHGSAWGRSEWCSIALEQHQQTERRYGTATRQCLRSRRNCSVSERCSVLNKAGGAPNGLRLIPLAFSVHAGLAGSQDALMKQMSREQ